MKLLYDVMSVWLMRDVQTIKVDEKTWTPLIKASEKYLMSLRSTRAIDERVR